MYFSHTKRRDIETIKNMATTANVSLKMSFSNPRLVKEAPEPPPVLPKPVPLACIRIRTIRAIEATICVVVRKGFSIVRLKYTTKVLPKK